MAPLSNITKVYFATSLESRHWIDFNTKEMAYFRGRKTALSTLVLSDKMCYQVHVSQGSGWAGLGLKNSAHRLYRFLSAQPIVGWAKVL